MTRAIPDELRHGPAGLAWPGTRVSAKSLWDDPVWRFPNLTAGTHRGRSEFDFRLVLLDETADYESARLTDSRYSGLLGEVRHFVYSLLADNRTSGVLLKTTALRNLQDEVGLFLRWMVSRGYERFGSVPVAAIDGSFLDYLLGEKVGGDDEQGLTVRSLAGFIAVPIRLHQQAPAMPPGSGLRGPPPFGGRSAIAVAQANCRKAVQAIPALPMDVFLPVMAEAMSWAAVKAGDVMRVHDACMEDVTPVPGDKTGRRRSVRALRVLEFLTLPGQRRPWREPIGDSIVARRRNGGDGEAAVDVLRQLRRLMLDARDACVCLIQGLVGLRISEVCGLRSEPFDEGTGLPACVAVEETLNGVYEAFYIRGRTYKGESAWQEVRWAAGLRPRGSTAVPPAIQAVLAIHRLFKRYRDMAGLAELVVGFTTSGLPKSGSNVVPAQSSGLRNGQKWWVAAYCGIPGSVRITTHMWRKTYALQLYRADPGLLPAISLHFKHLDTQTTYEGYVRGADPDLTSMVDEVSMSRDAELFRDIRHGRAQAGGRFYEGLMDGMGGNSGFFRGMEPQAEVEAIQEELQRSGVRSHECGWGRCLYRPEWARCGGGRLGPDEASRSPGTCSGCANMLVLPEHRDFWVARREANLGLLREHEAARNEHATAVPRDRVAQCDRMLATIGDFGEETR